MQTQRVKLPSTLSLDDVMAAAEEQMFGLGNDGFCLKCGHQQDGCEPDARGYRCEDCGANAVYGATEIMMVYGV